MEEMHKRFEEERKIQEEKWVKVNSEIEDLKNKMAEMQVEREIWEMQEVEKKEKKEEKQEEKKVSKKERDWEKLEREIEEEITIKRKQAVILTRGRKWRKEIKVEEWLRGILGDGDWWWSHAGNSGSRVKVFLESEEQKEKLMSLKKEMRESEMVLIDDWLSKVEQRNMTLMYIEVDRMVQKAREANIPMARVKEDRHVMINGVKHAWKDEKLKRVE